MSTPGNVLALRRAWPTLRAPSLDEVTGELVASFVSPLRTVAPAGLGLVGLPHWHGKRFRRDGDLLMGVNLIRKGAGLEERLPMTARIAPSLADGQPALAIVYAPDAPVPWRWVRDEVRVLPDGTMVGMTFVAVRGVDRLGGLPFLLKRAD